MSADAAADPVDTQLRLLLERRCAEVGRDVATRIGEGAPFALWMFDFGAGGHTAWCSTVPGHELQPAVAHWIEHGLTRPVMAESAALLVEMHRALGDEIKKRCPAGAGFAFMLLAGSEPFSYVSNAVRDDVRKALAEWLRMVSDA